jgi:carbon monoxide dehydrogenase subunit G
MRFENSFDVDAPIDEVYETLLDVDKVAPAMPGAQVTDHVGEDAYKVAIKVKLGPMTMNYRGDVEVRDKDSEAHRATMHVKAREARGQGNATADVVMSLDPRDGGTHATIAADVQLAGRAAAMGRGLIEDVSAKLVDQFANNLQEMLAGGNGGAPAAAEAAPATPGIGAENAGEASSSTAPPPPRPRPPVQEAEGVDALGIAAGVAGDKMRDPRVLLGTLLLVLLVGYLLGRRA